MRNFAAAAAVTLAMAASPLALAQTATPPAAPATTPSASPSATSSQPQWYSHQADEVRASKLIGTSVKNDAGERIGDVNEVILDKSGKVAAVVIGVGGFLGMGEHEVAVNFQSLRMSMDNSNRTVLSLSTNKDALKAAPQWTWASDGKSGTTGMTSPATKPSK